MSLGGLNVALKIRLKHIIQLQIQSLQNLLQRFQCDTLLAVFQSEQA